MILLYLLSWAEKQASLCRRRRRVTAHGTALARMYSTSSQLGDALIDSEQPKESSSPTT
jgi:hypothetical protein